MSAPPEELTCAHDWHFYSGSGAVGCRRCGATASNEEATQLLRERVSPLADKLEQIAQLMEEIAREIRA